MGERISNIFFSVGRIHLRLAALVGRTKVCDFSIPLVCYSDFFVLSACFGASLLRAILLWLAILLSCLEFCLGHLFLSL
jgi:hypothetical protein